MGKKQNKPDWNFVGKLGQYYILKNRVNFSLMKTTSKSKTMKLAGIEEL